MIKIVEQMRSLVERSAFGVCQDIGDRIGIRASQVRLFFIYTSFIALGSPLIIYMILAFWMNVKKYFTRQDEVIWD
jgi:phage shock protein C